MNAKLITTLFCVSLWMSGAVVAQEEQPATLVQVEKVTSQSIAKQLVVPGTVVSETDSQLASEVEGRIVWMAPVGTRVQQGDVLVKLDDTRLQFTLGQNQANVMRWESSVALLEKRRERLSSMAALNNASMEQLDEVSSELEIARQELHQATLTQQMTAYQIAQSSLTAPFDALVVEQIQSAGEFTRVGIPLVRVVNPNRIEAIVRAPLTVLPFIKEGMEVVVSDKLHDQQEAIKTIVPVGNTNSRMMEVRIALQPGDFAIGSAVRVALPHSDYREGMTVPRDALVLRQSGIFIYQIDENMQAKQVTVTTGIGVGERIEVMGPIHKEGVVVVRGAEYLRPGQKVRLNTTADSGTAKI